MSHRASVIIPLLLASCLGYSQQTALSLDSCRAMAITNNKKLKVAEEKQTAAYYNRKAAFTKYLPRVTAAASYIHTGDEIKLVSDEQSEKLGQLGSIAGQMAPMLQGMTDQLNAVGKGLAEDLETDTKNITAFSVLLTQPIYMGGKIKAYNNITRYAEQIADNSHDLELEDIIVDVDETYWKIVLLQNKKKLAESYLNLVNKLDEDLQKMIKEGVATTADELSVKVKVNEAQVTIIQIDNGISLCKMKMGQLCGLSDYNITLQDEYSEELPMTTVQTDLHTSANTAFENRLELKSLELASKIGDEKVNVERAAFLPSLALTGGYLLSNPSAFDGFENEFGGTWHVGVSLKVPVLTWGERNYKVKAAKAEANATRYQLDDVKEKIELQVNQCNQKLIEANERMKVAMSSQEKADENLRYANIGLQNNVIPVSNVIEAQTAWLSAHATYISAQIDLKLADVYLRKSLGTLK